MPKNQTDFVSLPSRRGGVVYRVRLSVLRVVGSIQALDKPSSMQPTNLLFALHKSTRIKHQGIVLEKIGQCWGPTLSYLPSPAEKSIWEEVGNYLAAR